jgi:heat-inducible transcriptional repressor
MQGSVRKKIMYDLTDRQMKLLKAVIDEYVNSSEPVGSQTIAKKYVLNCSAATIRNEMAKLIELGFLDMLHTSSGRVPTHLAYKFFLDEL